MIILSLIDIMSTIINALINKYRVKGLFCPPSQAYNYTFTIYIHANDNDSHLD